MRRLICVFVVRIWQKQVLSWRGSNYGQVCFLWCCIWQTIVSILLCSWFTDTIDTIGIRMSLKRSFSFFMWETGDDSFEFWSIMLNSNHNSYCLKVRKCYWSLHNVLLCQTLQDKHYIRESNDFLEEIWTAPHNQIAHPVLKTKRETTKYINWQQFTKGTRGKPNEQLFSRQVVIQLPKIY